MDIGKNLQQSFNLYRQNFGTLLLACLIAGVLAVITFGILAGPLAGGLLALALKLSRGEQGEFKEIFAHFDRFLPALLITLMLWAAALVTWIIAAIPAVGWIVNLIAGPALGLLYWLSIGFVVDQKRGPLEALRRSIDGCAAELLPLWVYALLVGILGGIGAVILGIGVILTMPLGIVGLTLAYQQLATKEVTPFKPEKQLLQITGLVIGVLFIAGLAFSIFGFGRHTSRNAGTDLASKIINGATGRKVTIKDQGGRIQIGDVSVGTGLPDNFPKDVPVYPRAVAGGYLGGKSGSLSGSTATFTSQDPLREIHDYYVQHLETQGWTVKTSEIGELTMIDFQKDSRRGGVTLTPDDSGTSIIIGIASE
jgi:MFS family permease